MPPPNAQLHIMVSRTGKSEKMHDGKFESVPENFDGSSGGRGSHAPISISLDFSNPVADLPNVFSLTVTQDIFLRVHTEYLAVTLTKYQNSSFSKALLFSGVMSPRHALIVANDRKLYFYSRC